MGNCISLRRYRIASSGPSQPNIHGLLPNSWDASPVLRTMWTSTFAEGCVMTAKKPGQIFRQYLLRNDPMTFWRLYAIIHGEEDPWIDRSLPDILDLVLKADKFWCVASIQHAPVGTIHWKTKREPKRDCLLSLHLLNRERRAHHPPRIWSCAYALAILLGSSYVTNNLSLRSTDVSSRIATLT